ncbi:MAG TPA: bifunctional DNA-binding transcriptional regulator/O6-methylguanine-DNA methyltransferase Ada [Polyangiales bacterium]
MNPFPTDHARWRAIVSRERTADGQFFYGVATTRVFCRPSCPSRRPLRKNVAFFASPIEATRAGYRACQRCRPEGADPRRERSKQIVRACRMLEGRDVSNQEIAQELGLSLFHFQRAFKAQTGVTPREYRRRVMSEHAKEQLASARTVTEAAYAAGYASSSRFYDAVGSELGMSAKDAQNGAKGHDVRYAVRACTLGRVLVAWTARGVCDVSLGDRDEELSAELAARLPGAKLAQTEVPRWVDDVVARVDRPSRELTTIPTDIRGTAFQERVWREIRRLGPGQTRTYSELARAIGAPTAARAVARACAENRIALLVPCHRVITSSGRVTGFRWGIARKVELLRRERATR